MGKVLVFGALILMTVCQAVWAQEPAATVLANDFTRSETNIPAADYPQVNSARQAMFRIYAPNAESVVISLGNTALTKGDDGYWTGVTEPLDEGFHYYTVSIDGASFADPSTETYFGSTWLQSGVEVSAHDQDFYQIRDVPHGDVRAKWYFSSITGEWRRCFVYTPPDYDTNTNARYPVLYLQHGWGEDARGWHIQGRVNFIMDNLLAEGAVVPMIIVMDDGMLSMPFNRLRGEGGGGQRGLFSIGAQFTEVMLADIIPFIDRSFRTLTDREHRAMAGLSMGGMEMFNITLPNLDRFSYIGGFSPGLPMDTINTLYEDPEGTNEKLKVFFLGAGGRERETNPNIWELHTALAEAGIRSTYYESPETAHEWLTWRRHLREFAPLLFQE